MQPDSPETPHSVRLFYTNVMLQSISILKLSVQYLGGLQPKRFLIWEGCTVRTSTKASLLPQPASGGVS